MAGGATDRAELIVVCATAAELPETASANRNVNRGASINNISPLIEWDRSRSKGARPGVACKRLTLPK